MQQANFGSQREVLWQAWTNLQASAQEALNRGAAHFFTCIKQAAASKLTVDALTHARLGQSDERIYDHLVYLMHVYQEVVILFKDFEDFEESEVPAPELVAGLCDVLMSRLGQFEDVASKNGNPVVREKRGILERAVLHTIQQIETLESDYAGLDYNPLIADPSNWMPLQEAVLSYVFPALEVYYKENLDRCLTNLNDLHNRTTASLYVDLLEREWEVLGLIIQVQVKAIESSGAEATAPILTKLREAYQQTGSAVGKFHKLMQSAPNPVPGISYEEIATAMTAPQPAELDSGLLCATLVCEADVIFEAIRNKHLDAAQGLNELVTVETGLAESVIAAFDTATKELISVPENISELNLLEEPEGEAVVEPFPEAEIMSGIVETLTIKVESLQESLDTYNESIAEILTALSDMPVLTGNDLKEAAYELKDAWCSAPPTEDTAEEFFAKAAELTAFVSYNSKFEKHVSAQTAKLDKTTFRFHRESLLYEISTYEEILYYSVSRLREVPHLADAVKILDGTFLNLEALITTHGIIVLRPAPHEPFNGREQEVLTAEEKEGYAKGTIIKTMTSGYKKDDQVIIRANVIAAR